MHRTSYQVKGPNLTLVKISVSIREARIIKPWHFVLLPLHVPFVWHFLNQEPLKMKPSSQLNFKKFGYVVSLPTIVPFRGASSFPQSIALTKISYLVSNLYSFSYEHWTEKKKQISDSSRARGLWYIGWTL